MKRISLSVLALTALFSFTAPGSPQEGPKRERPPQLPVLVRPLTHPRGLSKSAVGSTRSFYQSKADWRRIVDSAWGPGLPFARKLALFDAFAANLSNSFDGFLSLGLNWDSLRTSYRSKIDSSTSRGRFAAIMARFGMSLRDGHTAALDTIVTFTPLSPGVPVLVLTPFATAEHFGAVLTMLPDSSALVLRTVPNHPLGLEPGDIVLGYEGVPWKELVKELLGAEIPVYSEGVGARSAESHALFRNVGNNWHLFETIDILKYATKETLHLSVYPLLTLPPNPILGNEQLDIAGIPSDFYSADPRNNFFVGQPVHYAKLPVGDVGYIRLRGEWPTDLTDALFAAAVNDLWNTKGLIIDLRYNTGGWALFDQAFSKMFSEALFTIEDAYRAGPTDWTLVPAGNRSQFVIPGITGSIFDRPIAVLLGPTCISMGDLTAQRLRYHPMVRFFGKPPMAAHGDNKRVSDYRDWLINYSLSDMFHTSQPGVYLNRMEFPIDEEVWMTPDGVAKGKDDVVERALAWITALVHGHTTDLNRHFGRPGLDSLTVTAILANPEGHQTRITAVLTNAPGTLCDSMLLFNDGRHGDGAAGDSLWGARLLAPAVEGFFDVSLQTDDLTAGTSRRLPKAALLTTAGPVECLRDTLASQEKVWGQTLRLRLQVVNRGSTAPTPAVTGTIRSLDTASATILTGTPFSVGDLEPGVARISSYISLAFAASQKGTQRLPFELLFYTSGLPCWGDTLWLEVTEPTSGVAITEAELPREYRLAQNYPNPFNPSTTIRYALPQRARVTLTIFNTLGQKVAELVNADIDAGYHEVKFEGSNLSSGVYFYRLQAGSFFEVKSLVVLK